MNRMNRVRSRIRMRIMLTMTMATTIVTMIMLPRITMMMMMMMMMKCAARILTAERVCCFEHVRRKSVLRMGSLSHGSNMPKVGSCLVAESA